MHICFICREYPPSLRGGGIASYIKEVSHGLHDAGHQVTVIAASDDTRLSSEEEDDGGVRVIRLAGGDFLIPQMEGNSPWKKFRTFYRFHSYRWKVREAVLKLKDVDVIEVPEYGAEGYCLKNIGIPIVTRLHTPMLLDHYHFSLQKLSKANLKYYWQGRKELEMIRKSRFVTSCSSSLKEWCERFLYIDGKRIKVIFNPILSSRWKYEEPTMRRQDSKKHILFVGTICDWKGCGDLAEACKLLADSGEIGDFQLDLVGKTGAFADELQMKFGNEEWFHLIGKLPREEVMHRYAQADVVCFPSWWENMPMVCIEAMLSGAIVIGSDAGGMSEIIENGKSGFLLSPRNPQAWADKIKEVCLLSDSQKKLLREEAHLRILSRFDMDVIIPQMVDYYHQVIKEYNCN